MPPSSERPLDAHEIRCLRGMIDEYEFARRRNLLATQRWRSLRVWSLYVVGGTLYVIQLTIAIIALTHH